MKNIVDEIFKDHHDCMGLSEEEIEDLIDESDFLERYNWLKKNGYDID
ncbi:MAG: hypothetical protein IJJ10_07465 [Bacillus sp. (in: Bacteria)]|nr:hypothetical protein [Bacillus sp. (in: firmicutes)]